MMTSEELDKRIAAANKEFLSEDEQPATDYYKQNVSAIDKELSKKKPNGARAKMMIEGRYIMDGLAFENEKAKRARDIAIARGDNKVAGLIMSQYMQDKFLPAIETLVRLNSASELLNSEKMLEELDKRAIVPSNQSASGYTKAFVISLYQDELQNPTPPVMSDSTVRCCMRDINNLMQSGNIRTAVGKAEKMLKKIDAGQQIAVDDDYLILQKIASRGR